MQSTVAAASSACVHCSRTLIENNHLETLLALPCLVQVSETLSGPACVCAHQCNNATLSASCACAIATGPAPWSRACGACRQALAGGSGVLLLLASLVSLDPHGTTSLPRTCVPDGVRVREDPLRQRPPRFSLQVQGRHSRQQLLACGVPPATGLPLWRKACEGSCCGRAVTRRAGEWRAEGRKGHAPAPARRPLARVARVLGLCWVAAQQLANTA